MQNVAILDASRPLPAWTAWGLAALTGLSCGTLTGLWEPRGPVTPFGAVVTLGIGLVVGLIAGLVTRSGWSALVVAGCHIAAFELIRSSSRLPTVGALRLDTSFGVLAFVLGRVIPWALATIPMAIGVRWALRVGRPGRRPLALGATSLVLALLAGWLVIPPAPPAVTGDGGEPVPGSFAQLVPVQLGGHRQWIEVRGTREDNPVLLYLSGGPGQSDLAFSRVLLEPITRDFTIVGWDQRGTGKSYPELDERTLTLQQAVADTVELAQQLRTRFHQPRIYLLGESWGSLLGVLAVQQAPELFAAYIGSGQMVDIRETDRRIYQDLAALAARTGDKDLSDQLARIGTPPYRSVFDNGFVLTKYPLLEGAYTPPEAYRRRAATGAVGPMGVLGSEYGPLDKLNVIRGLMDMFSVMYPQLQSIDLRREAPSLEVPVYLISGTHELAARTEPARAWFEALRAPTKRWYSYPDVGHSAAFERADDLHRILLREVPPVAP